jgi:hypothetical protein
MTLAFLVSLLLPVTPLTVPFDLDARYGSIFVTVTINGRPATLLVDTGAASTIVRPELAGVRLPALDRSRFRGDVGFEARGVWQTVQFGLGKTWSTPLEVGAVDLTEAMQRYGRRVDGLLGQDVLRRFRRVTFDYATKKLLLEK